MAWTGLAYSVAKSGRKIAQVHKVFAGDVPESGAHRVKLRVAFAVFLDRPYSPAGTSMAGAFAGSSGCQSKSPPLRLSGIAERAKTNCVGLTLTNKLRQPFLKNPTSDSLADLLVLRC